MSKPSKKAPELRFKGFSDAWEQRKLGEITLKIGSGKTPKGGESSYALKGIPFLRSQNVHNDLICLNDVAYITPQTDEEMKNSRVVKNDVLLNITGASIGRSAVYRYSKSANVNQHVCIVRPCKDYSSGFIQLNLTSPKGQQQIDSNQAGGGREGLNFKQIGELNFAFPSIEEQDEISVFLSEIDHLITLHQRKLDALKRLKKAYLQKLFPMNGESVPKLRFANFGEKWEQRKFKDIVDIQSGRDYKHLSKGNIPVYGTGGYMLNVSKALSYTQDGIGIGRKGTIDKPYLLRAPFWTVDTLFYAIPKENNDLDFVHSIFQRVNWKRKDESTGVPSLSKRTINMVKVAIPELEEQMEVGSYYSQLDHLITLHQNKLEQFQQLKQAYLQKMFI